MSKPILSVDLLMEHDVVLARQRGPDRWWGCSVSMDKADPDVHRHGGFRDRPRVPVRRWGRLEFLFEEPTATLMIRIRDQGPGVFDLQSVLDGRYRLAYRHGPGDHRRAGLMDRFQIDLSPRAGKIMVEFGKAYPGTPRSFYVATPRSLLTSWPCGKRRALMTRCGSRTRNCCTRWKELRRRQAELASANEACRAPCGAAG